MQPTPPDGSLPYHWTPYPPPPSPTYNCYHSGPYCLLWSLRNWVEPMTTPGDRQYLRLWDPVDLAAAWWEKVKDQDTAAIKAFSSYDENNRTKVWMEPSARTGIVP
uniref:Uncharacterized protein n=1 Tax=Physcomitrium patens TaxID=3218 RepID=A0A2K1K2G9_PHYPA|nr:hypothetical protein PHYPA_012447 [Physcomitrium patens]